MVKEASEMKKMVVQIVSKENILPTSPTPSHLKVYKLSVFDQVQVKLYMSMMLFYHNNDTTSNLDSVIQARSKLLKQSLSDTLTRFYPFAGKVRDNLHIDCNDEGVYYIETRVNSSLSEVLSHPLEDDTIRRLVPQEATESPMNNYVLIIQVNFFSCGGISLSTCISHKLVDGNTYTLFLQDWTAATRGSSSETVSPSFIAPSLFPQISSLSFEDPNAIINAKFVSKRFVFDGLHIQSLIAKTKDLSSCKPTRFEVVSALLWKCVAKAAYKLNNSALETPFNLAVFINLRGKNCVPKNSIGNIIWPSLAQCKLAPKLDHQLLVDQIKKCKAEVNDDFVEAIKGDNGTSTIIKVVEMIKSDEISFSLWITSMCNMGLYDLDFGWGKPVWFYYCNLKMSNLISLCETRTGGGIQAVVSLDEQEMAIVENDPELLAFASINPAPCEL